MVGPIAKSFEHKENKRELGPKRKRHVEMLGGKRILDTRTSAPFWVRDRWPLRALSKASYRISHAVGVREGCAFLATIWPSGGGTQTGKNKSGLGHLDHGHIKVRVFVPPLD